MDLSSLLLILEAELESGLLTSPVECENNCTKIGLRKIFIKGKEVIQLTRSIGVQVFHENKDKKACVDFIEDALTISFSQGIFQTASHEYHVVKKGKEFKIFQKEKKHSKLKFEHNREKNHILKEGVVYPFLVELGITNHEGKLLAKMQHKFRQINQFLSHLAQLLPLFPEDKIHIVEIGSGKAYLTFAVYYFLTVMHGKQVVLLGLDLKKPVVDFCNDCAKKLGFENLKFLCQNATENLGVTEVDLVMALHACDTATDMALKHAVSWKAKAILAAPCCQQELFKQIQCKELNLLLKHGIFKERFAALATDALRGAWLENHGYDVSMIEFVDAEETLKNILIRAIKNPSKKGDAKAVQAFKEFLHLDPFIDQGT